MTHSTKVERRAVVEDPTLLTEPPSFENPGEYTKKYKAAKRKAKEVLKAERKEKIHEWIKTVKN